MKKLSILLLTLPGFYFAQLASGITIHDTRSTDSPPSEYRHQIQGDFKYRSTVGVPGEGLYSGMLTITPWGDNSGDKHHQLNFNNGGIFYRAGLPEGQWEGWKQLLTTNSNGNVGIGTTNPKAKLDINGTMMVGGDIGNLDITNLPNSLNMLKNTGKLAIGWNLSGGRGETDFISNRGRGSAGGFDFYDYTNEGQRKRLLLLNSNGNALLDGKFEAKEIKVTTTPTADFVFEDTYQLPDLESVEKHIKEKKHLPEIASAAEMQKEGVNIGDFQIKLLQKIEELTLYSIEQNKIIKEQQERLKKLEEKQIIKP